MKLCTHCRRITQGAHWICSQYGKAPPADSFAERCRHFEQGEPPQEVQRVCSECERFDTDETGTSWCRLPDTGEWITYRPIRERMRCPLD